MFAFCEHSIIILPQGEVHEGDYFAGGNSVEIAGVVTGDVFVYGTQIFIDGNVHGDVIAIGGSVSITGRVEGDVRIVSGQVTIAGDVMGSVTLVTGNGELLPSGKVGNNLVAITANIDMNMPIRNNATVFASNARLAGFVGKNVEAIVGTIHVTSTAAVDGSLNYWSTDQAKISPRAKVRDVVYHQSVEWKEYASGTFLVAVRYITKYLSLLMNFFYSFIMGLIIMRFFPRKVHGALRAITERPVMAFASGAIVLIVIPIAFLALLISVIGAPFALTLMAVNLFGLYTVKVVVILWVMAHFFPQRFQRKKRSFLFLGLIAYFIVTAIPYLGWIVAVVSMLLGLGALIVSKQNLSWPTDQLSDTT